jgi:hypothetical protein
VFEFGYAGLIPMTPVSGRGTVYAYTAARHQGSSPRSASTRPYLGLLTNSSEPSRRLYAVRPEAQAVAAALHVAHRVACASPLGRVADHRPDPLQRSPGHRAHVNVPPSGQRARRRQRLDDLLVPAEVGPAPGRRAAAASLVREQGGGPISLKGS